MNQRTFLIASTAAAVVAAMIAVAPLAAQSSSVAAKPDTAPAAKSSPSSGGSFVAPKTPWGAPDLQGTWTSDDTWGVPFERPKKFGTRATLTEDELKDREKNVERSEEFIDTGGANHSPAVAELEAKKKGEAAPAPPPGRFGRGVDAAPVPGHWGEFARRASHQTSQVVDPPDGRIPPLTPEAQAKLEAKMKLRRDPIPASYTNWSYYDRCITRGVAGSILPVIYGNGLEIVQTPGYVAIRYEMVHDVRHHPYRWPPASKFQHSLLHGRRGGPLGRQDAGGGNHQFAGRPDGRWRQRRWGPSLQRRHETDRAFHARRLPTSSIIELTVDDPKTYTAPWTVAFPITHEPGYKLFEYACHEGNMAMHNMLSTARMEDAKKAAGEAAK